MCAPILIPLYNALLSESLVVNIRFIPGYRYMLIIALLFCIILITQTSWLVKLGLFKIKNINIVFGLVKFASYVYIHVF